MKKLLTLACALCMAGGAWAALGAAPSVAVGDGSARADAGANASHLQKQLASGTEVHEFVDTAGTVFAVAWAGPFLPDLRALLGAHFETLQREEAAGGTRRSSALSIDTPALVLSASGRMRAFEGRAWLPDRLPAGFDTRNIP